MTFNEHIIQRKRDSKEIVISVILYLAATVLAALSIMFLIMLPQIAVLIAALFYYLAYRISSNMKKEFEYIFTQDSVTIDVIMNASRRKRLLTFNAAELEILAPIEGLSTIRNTNFEKTIDATSKSKIAAVYYAVVSKEDKRILVKFEPPYSFLKEFYKYAPSKITLD